MQLGKRENKAKHYEVDMTVGKPFHHLLNFAIPLLLGNLFQQFYNMVDTWVVGNYVSNEAFSAVGTVGPIINLLIGAFSGLASGAGVVISQYFGAGDERKVHEAVHTSIVLTAAMSVAFTVLGIVITPMTLRMMNTPAEVFPESQAYLTIYFAGMTGLLFYNMGAGILRAVGDSRRPFYFLLVAAALNTGLDLLFVIAFGMGVEGVAYATIIAQFGSAICTTVALLRTDSCVRVHLSKLRCHRDALSKIVRVGIPASIQMAITSFSNIFVQGYINYFGTDCMGGWTAYSKIDQLIFLPMQSLALAATTFVGQNLGKGQVDNAKRGVRTSLMMAFVSTAVISAVVILGAEPLVRFFNDKDAVVSYGALFIRWLTPFYVFCCVNQIYTGALRGSGDSRAPMIIMLASFVVFRQIYLFVMAKFIANEVIPIGMGYPAGWLVCSVLTFVYYKRANLSRNRLVADAAR